MAEKNKTLLERLHAGEKVLCEKCGKGYLQSNGDANTSYYFECSNKNCYGHVHITPNVNIFDYDTRADRI